MMELMMKSHVRMLGIVLGVGMGTVPGVALGEDGGAEPKAEVEESGEGDSVRVAVEPTMPDAEATQGWIEERAQQVVDELQWPLEDEGRLVVRVSGTPYDYRIEVSAWWRGELLSAETQPQGVECECDSDEMLDQVGEAVRAGATALIAVAEQERVVDAARERAAKEAAVEERAEAVRLAALEAEHDSAYRLGKLGSYGVGMGSVGVLVAISGSIMVGQGSREPEVSWERRVDRLSGPGFAVLGVGAAVAVAGVSVLIADVIRCRRKVGRCGEGSSVVRVSWDGWGRM